MAASGKSAGKSPGQPAPGPGKGGGQPTRPPMAGYYNAADDFYGPGMQIQQPMANYYNQYPSPFPTYSPPTYGGDYAPFQNPYGGAYSDFRGGYNPYTPTYVQNAQDQNYNSTEVQQAYGSGASAEAGANELAAFNMGVQDADGDGRISDQEFSSWSGYDNWLAQNPNHATGDNDPGRQSGSRFTGQYDANGYPVYSGPAYNHDNYAGRQSYGGYGGYNSYGGYNPYGQSSYSPYGGYGGYGGYAGVNPFQSSYQPYNAYSNFANSGMDFGSGQALYDALIDQFVNNSGQEEEQAAAPAGPNYSGAYSDRASRGGTVATMGNPFAMAAVDANTQDLRNVMIDDGQGNSGRVNVNFDQLSEAQRNALIQIAQDNPDMGTRSRSAYDYMQSQFGFA